MSKRKEGFIKFQVFITPEDHASLKAFSAVSGRSMGSIGGEMLAKYLKVKLTTEAIRARRTEPAKKAEKPDLSDREQAREEGLKQAEKFLGPVRARTIY